MPFAQRRPGHIDGMWLAFLGSAGALIVLIGMLVWDPSKWQAPQDEVLMVYCAAGLKVPVEAVAKEYEAEYGIPVRLQFGGSQTLLASLEISQIGDLYISADETYVQLAQDKKLVDETMPLATMKLVVAVAKGNPKKIHTLDDLERGDVRLEQANPDAAAVGKLTRGVLQKINRWDRLAKHTRGMKLTVNDVANDIILGAADAGIVWDALIPQYASLEGVSLPELEAAQARIGVCVLHSTKQPSAALRFARYLAARDRGLKQFEKSGYQPAAGDTWAWEPEIRVLAGAMLRPAIEQTIRDFEAREGVKVKRVYNGCGILVSQMRAGEHPDVYFACDTSFMSQVNDLFLDSVDVSTNQLVIIVHKGNPHDINTLEDLGKPGLRVGIGHEKQCAMGTLTQRTFKEGRVSDKVHRNIAVQSPTGDMLINQMRTGSLDAVIAYISNAASAGDELEAIKIDIPCAMAVQPFAIGRESEHKQLTARLLALLRTAASRQRFESYGFHWQEQQEEKPAPAGKPAAGAAKRK